MHPTFTATVTDTVGGYSSYIAPIQANALVAARNWGQFIVGSGQIDIQIDIAQSPSNTADGASTSAKTLSPAILFEGRNRYHMQYGTLTEIITGSDPNGTTSDIIIHIDPDRLNDNYGSYWFDSNPYDQIHVVPSLKVDGLKTLTHEIGHALGISGYRDWSTGVLQVDGSGNSFFSNFDKYVVMVDGKPYFTGPTAKSVYGAAVPLTSGNLYHYGNSQGAGADLVKSGLMNGVVSNVGVEYNISNLDLSILQDIGFNIAFKENIFRFYNNSTGTHFYTANIDEKNSVKANLAQFSYVGVGFQTDATAQTGNAVYRFYNPSKNSHFYTINESERDSVIKNLPAYNYEGEAFYAYKNNAAGNHEALYRFFNTATGTHFYTPNTIERDNVMATLPSYKYEGIAFYIE